MSPLGFRVDRRLAKVLPAVLTIILILAASAGSASAATPAPGWNLDNLAAPTNFSTDQNGECLATLGDEVPRCDSYQLTAINVGSVATDGTPIRLSESVPPGLTVQKLVLNWKGAVAKREGLESLNFAEAFCPSATVECEVPFTLEPEELLELHVYLTVDEPSASGPIAAHGAVEAGGAPSASAIASNQLSSGPAPFGPVAFSSYAVGVDGKPSTQAGGHPYALTTRINLASAVRHNGPEGLINVSSVEDVKDVVVDLPLGLVGSDLAAPRCTFADLASKSFGGGGCAADTVVGHIRTEPTGLVTSADSPIFNMVPEGGVAAEFGFVDLGGASHVLYARVVPSPEGYVLQVRSLAPQITATDFITSFFGNPAARNGTGNTPLAMFTNPAACNGRPLTTTVHIDSWNHPGPFRADGTPELSDPNWVSMSSGAPPVTGCNQLQFHPHLSVQPDSTSADSPSGLDVELTVPQSENPNTLGTPPLKRAVVTLPPGLVVNPSAADGLQACSPAQIDLGSAAPPSCPDASKVGTVQLESPLLPGVLAGSIYLASQFDNPFHSLLAGYIVVDDPTTGVVIKIPGNLTPEPATGQISGVFDDNPQFPFSDLKLHFFGGARGELTTPSTCGSFQTTSELTPWSAPDSGPAATPSDTFTTATGPGGGSCPSASAFAPSLTAGTATPIAGLYSPFVFKVERENGSQRISAIDATLPEGLLGRLAGIPYCSDAQIAAADARSNPGEGALERARPSCPAASASRHRHRRRRRRAHPLLRPGPRLPRRPLQGRPALRSRSSPRRSPAPSTSAPSSSGPPSTSTRNHAQIHAVRSDPLPRSSHGIPLDIRSIAVDIDRPNFTLNPTSCEPMAIAGAATSTLGSVAPLSEPLPGRRLRRARLQAQAQPAASRARPSARGHPALTRDARPTRKRATPTSPAPRSPCRTPSSSTTPTSARSAPACSSPPTPVPAGLDLRPRHGDHPAARLAAAKARSTCAPPTTSCPTWSPP